MTVQSDSKSNARRAARTRLAVLAAALAACVVVAIAGLSWVQFAERMLELPGLRFAFDEWATELMNPDSVMRRAIKRTTRG